MINTVRHSIKFFTIFLSFVAVSLAGGSLFAQYHNLSSGSFTAAGVPGTPSTSTEITAQDTVGVPVTKSSFTFKRYFKALSHKDTMDVAHMFFGSMILPGSAQIYNRQTWKLPILYGAVGGFVGGAIAYNVKYQRDGTSGAKQMRNLMIAGAALTYYGSLLDGVISFKSDREPLPARASIYSALLPGLGQAYNGDYWKIPIFYGGFTVSIYCWAFNQTQYKRYRNMYIDAMSENSTYTGSLSTDDMIWYRDKFRRYRDYSIIATAIIYVLNIIDANVFAYFSDFDVSDDITLKVSPGIIENIPPNGKINSFDYYGQAIGLKINMNF